MQLTSLLLPLADYDGHMDWGNGWGTVMIVGMIIFWIAVLLAAVWLIRDLAGSRRESRAQGAADPDPLRTLDLRLAEGKISAEDYRERRATLEEHRSG